MIQQVLPVLMLMVDVLLPHVSLIHIGVIIHSCLRHPHNAMVHYCWPLPGKYNTDMNIADA